MDIGVRSGSPRATPLERRLRVGCGLMAMEVLTPDIDDPTIYLRGELVLVFALCAAIKTTTAPKLSHRGCRGWLRGQDLTAAELVFA